MSSRWHPLPESLVDAPRFSPRFRADRTLAEADCRRAGWTAGRPLELADGQGWSLPRIDGTLLVVRPRILDDLAGAFDLAHLADAAGPDVPTQVRAAACYHAQLAQLAVVLLQANYDLGPGRWRRLLAFESLDRMLRMTHEVGQAVADSVAAWMPFYRTRGRDDRDDLRRN